MGATQIDAGQVVYDLHGNATRIGDQTWTYDATDQVTGTTVLSTGETLVYTRDVTGRVTKRHATEPPRVSWRVVTSLKGWSHARTEEVQRRVA